MAGTYHVDIGLLHKLQVANHSVPTHMLSGTRMLLVAVHSFEFHRFAIDIKKQVPDFDLIQVVRWFIENDHQVFFWSGGGIDYSQMIIDKLGLTNKVKALPKVKLGDKSNPHNIDIAFDDEETNLAKVNIKVKRPKYD